MSDDKKQRKAESKAKKKQAKAAAKQMKAATKVAVAGETSGRVGAGRGDAGGPSAGAFNAGESRVSPLRRIVGQSVLQLVVRIIGGLVVAYILIRLGMR